MIDMLLQNEPIALEHNCYAHVEEYNNKSIVQNELTHDIQ